MTIKIYNNLSNYFLCQLKIQWMYTHNCPLFDPDSVNFAHIPFRSSDPIIIQSRFHSQAKTRSCTPEACFGAEESTFHWKPPPSPARDHNRIQFPNCARVRKQRQLLQFTLQLPDQPGQLCFRNPTNFQPSTEGVTCDFHYIECICNTRRNWTSFSRVNVVQSCPRHRNSFSRRCLQYPPKLPKAKLDPGGLRKGQGGDVFSPGIPVVCPCPAGAGSFSLGRENAG